MPRLALLLVACALVTPAPADDATGGVVRIGGAEYALRDLSLGWRGYRCGDEIYASDGERLTVVNVATRAVARPVETRLEVRALLPKRGLALVRAKDELALVEFPATRPVAALKVADIASHWSASPDERFLFPHRADGDAYPIVDVAGRALRHVEPDKAVERPATFHALPAGKWMLVHARGPRGAGEVILIDRADPDHQLRHADALGIDRLFAVAGDTLYATRRDPADPAGPPRIVAIDWARHTIRATCAALDADRVQWMGPGPARGDLYVIDAHAGLRVLDAATLEPRAALRDGRSVNAATAGVTFSPDGKLALVGTPYGRQVTVLDTATYKPVECLPVGEGPAGALLLPPVAGAARGTLLILHVTLPYE